MSGKESIKECYKCHYRFPISELSVRKISKNTASAVGVSVNPNRKKSSRFSGRSYYRHKEVWICDGCYGFFLRMWDSIRAFIAFVIKLIIWLFVALIAYLIYDNSQKPSSKNTEEEKVEEKDKRFQPNDMTGTGSAVSSDQ